MLTRRSLLAGTVALVAGCSTLESTFTPPNVPEETALDWAVLGGFVSLFDPENQLLSDDRVLQRGLDALAEDVENPYGPQRGRYSLTLRYSRHWPERDPPPNSADEILDIAKEWLDGFSADLVALPPFIARWLGENGLVLPLERFMGADGTKVEAEFVPSSLEQSRGHGGLYALPVSALPLMVSYDAAYFKRMGAPPPDGSWRWDDLVSHAERLTQRDEEGEVTRWGMVAYEPFGSGLWWALWQNEAAIVDPETLRCLLHEPAA